jgi:hypothetical protein
MRVIPTTWGVAGSSGSLAKGLPGHVRVEDISLGCNFPFLGVVG